MAKDKDKGHSGTEIAARRGQRKMQHVNSPVGSPSSLGFDEKLRTSLYVPLRRGSGKYHCPVGSGAGLSDTRVLRARIQKSAELRLFALGLREGEVKKWKHVQTFIQDDASPELGSRNTLAARGKRGWHSREESAQIYSSSSMRCSVRTFGCSHVHFRGVTRVPLWQTSGASPRCVRLGLILFPGACLARGAVQAFGGARNTGNGLSITQKS